MRPRNDKEREVMRLSAALPPLTEKQQQWAFDHCFEKVAYISKTEAWCTHCGSTFSALGISPLGVSLLGDGVVCPHCGTRLECKNSRKMKLSERWYYTTITTAGRWQVCRHFIAEKDIRKGGTPWLQIREAVQNWINRCGEEIVVARPVSCMPHVYDAWNFAKPMEVRRNHAKRSTYEVNKYQIHSEYTYPVRGVKRLLRRNGFSAACDVIPPSELMKMLLRDNEAEMLVKTRQYSLLRFKWTWGFGEGRMPQPHAIRIANRWGYIVEDATMWYDYLSMLDYFHLDTRNPRYICPANLKEEHDRLSLRKQRVEAKKKAEEKAREAAKWEEQYRKDKGIYFGICFGNDDIKISVISSVAAMAEEGKAMHHCVYDSRYFLKPDSLILTARSATDGERIETIEVSLKTFEVVQSRAKCNKVSKYHDEILRLVRNNIGAIIQIKNAA